jgi:hypothetical protein
MYVPVLVIDMDFYSLVIGLMVKPLFAFTSDISFYILHIGNTVKQNYFTIYFRGFLERENMPFWYNKIGDVLVKSGGVFFTCLVLSSEVHAHVS